MLVGYGDIATRLAGQLLDKGYDITGLRRRAAEQDGVRMIAGDVCDTPAMIELLRQEFDYIVITLAPDQRDEPGYRDTYYRGVESLVAAIDKSARSPKCVIFASSTSVYGQDSGEWVDEVSATHPKRFTGRVLLETEQLLQQSTIPNCIVRFAGIYGPGRCHLVEQVRSGTAIHNPLAWTNRIHSEDCAGVLEHLLQRHQDGRHLDPIYIGSDLEPAMQWQVRSWLAEQMAMAAPAAEEQVVFEEAGKRCSNRLLCESGYRFHYPDFRAGYASLL